MGLHSLLLIIDNKFLVAIFFWFSVILYIFENKFSAAFFCCFSVIPHIFRAAFTIGFTIAIILFLIVLVNLLPPGIFASARGICDIICAFTLFSQAFRVLALTILLWPKI